MITAARPNKRFAAHAAITGGRVPARPREMAKAKTIHYENPMMIPIPML